MKKLSMLMLVLGLAACGNSKKAEGGATSDEGTAPTGPTAMEHAGHGEAEDPHADHDDHDDHGEHAAGEHGDHDHQALEVGEPSEESVFLLDSEWTNSDGKKTKLDVVKGHPTIVLMFYGSCESVCPVLIEDVKKTFAGLSDAAKAKTRVLLVSFDPKRDTPEKLAAMAKKRGADQPGWYLLHGTDSQVRKLSLVLGIQYRETADGQFNHSNVLTLLDAEGRVAHQVEGVGKPADEIIERIEKAAGGGGTVEHADH
ncbi:MAG: SCO family protein [Myxococcales bacterium]|nr:SCO family protein [Myxococcales bacterium]